MSFGYACCGQCPRSLRQEVRSRTLSFISPPSFSACRFHSQSPSVSSLFCRLPSVSFLLFFPHRFSRPALFVSYYQRFLLTCIILYYPLSTCRVQTDVFPYHLLFLSVSFLMSVPLFNSFFVFAVSNYAPRKKGTERRTRESDQRISFQPRLAGGIFVGSAKPLSGLGFRCTLHEKSERERDVIAGQRKKENNVVSERGKREFLSASANGNVLQEVSVFRHNHAIPSLRLSVVPFAFLIYFTICEILYHALFSFSLRSGCIIRYYI